MKIGFTLLLLFPLLLPTWPAAAFDLTHDECHRPNDEASRVETARRILKVNAKDWKEVVTFWADQPVPKEQGGQGAIYKEVVATIYSRQEMANYLELMFQWSSDMEMEILEEQYVTRPDGTMTYMATNRWFGTGTSGPYIQPGMSIIKFEDPKSGCATYQRDYFSEGDLWWGIPQLHPVVKQVRDGYISRFGLKDKCFDEDGDGYSKYDTTGCPKPGVDCNDYADSIHPSAKETCNDGIDNNCNGHIDCSDPQCLGGTACGNQTEGARK